MKNCIAQGSKKGCTDMRMPRGLEVIITEFIHCSFNFFVAVRTVLDSATVAALHHHHHNYHSLNAILHYSTFYKAFGFVNRRKSSTDHLCQLGL
jgi:hypothetical protein